MPHTTNGIDVLLVVVFLVAVFAWISYSAWRREDQDRRRDRLVQRRMEEMTGRWVP